MIKLQELIDEHIEKIELPSLESEEMDKHYIDMSGSLWVIIQYITALTLTLNDKPENEVKANLKKTITQLVSKAIDRAYKDDLTVKVALKSK